MTCPFLTGDLNRNYAHHTQYANNDPNQAQDTQIFKPVLHVSEVSEEAEKDKEE